jgi:phosphoribosyl-AMP cyclohydrolase
MLRPDFEKGNGLLPAIVQEYRTGKVLMLAYMNEEAWQMTLKDQESYFYSRSRNSLWHKGESSGHVQKIRAIRLDCDCDTILLVVEQIGGAACHKGYESCFYRELNHSGFRECCEKIFEPEEVYNK